MNSEQTESSSTVEVTWQASPTTGFAAIQNDVPIVRTVTLRNTGAVALQGLDVRLTCSPPFARGEVFRLEELAPNETRVLTVGDLCPEHGYLSALDEAERGTLRVEVICEGTVLATFSQPIVVLAYDQWAGTRALPELLAAFCMPNSPAVDRLLGAAATLGEVQDAGFALEGYRAGQRQRVWQQVSAVYNAVRAEGLRYALPPATFHDDGQRIRTPDRVLEGRIATCLELALLFAACFEQAGLHPVLLIQEGHAWVGVWLVDTRLSSALVDDVQAVRKRVQAGELMVFETTLVVQPTPATLEFAWRAGAAHLDAAEEKRFLWALDVRAARAQRVRPLPSRGLAMAVQPNRDSAAPLGIEAMPELPPLDAALLPVAASTAVEAGGRLAVWKSKLLDLTLRNRLLNFKPTQSNLRLVAGDLSALLGRLMEGGEFRVQALTNAADNPQDPRSEAAFERRTTTKPAITQAIEALTDDVLLAEVDAEKLADRMTGLCRAARTAIEEGGANTLYLAFGMLRWSDAEKGEASYSAPLLMVPVQLVRASVKAGVRLRRLDDDVLVNPTLLLKLANDFDLHIPSLDELLRDREAVDLSRVLQAFRLAVTEMRGWEVVEAVHLGLFSFAKYLMWKDLQDRMNLLACNPIVAHLVDGRGLATKDTTELDAIRNLDDRFTPQALCLPLLADSSQVRAVAAAADGGSLVLEGPPGTGKSQTITNLICQLLATDQTVLFVSEKMAALDVVHRRLNAVGLGAFCLELHSAKASKASVLEQLRLSLASAQNATELDWSTEAERLASLRSALNGWAEVMHRVHGNGLTLFKAMGSCMQHAQWAPAQFAWPEPHIHDRAQLDALREQSRQVSALASQLPSVNGHPLRIFRKARWTPSWQDAFLKASDALGAASRVLEVCAEPVLAALGRDDWACSWADLQRLDRLADVLLRSCGVPTSVAAMALDGEAVRAVQALVATGERRSAAWQPLASAYKASIAGMDVDELESAWCNACVAWWPKRWFAQRQCRGRVAGYRLDGRAAQHAEFEAMIDGVRLVRREDAALAGMRETASCLGDEYTGSDTDWARVRTHLAWLREYIDALTAVSADAGEQREALNLALQPLFGARRIELRPSGALALALTRFRDAYGKLCVQVDTVTEIGEAAEPIAGIGDAAGALTSLQRLTQQWSQQRAALQPWCVWQAAKARAEAAGLGPWVTELEAGTVPLSAAADYFEYSYQRWWLHAMLDREPLVCDFASADHERKIQEFRETDARFQKLTERYVFAKLAAQLPSSAELAMGVESELGGLRRELTKQRRHRPVRQLLQGMPTLLARLKPCLLMSPLSVAQYLDVAHSSFDVVIFDEASQMPVWDAVGAIARSKRLVCVGDPKQLPPTHFFESVGDSVGAVVDAEQASPVEELESVLDECLSAGLPKRSLDWHYRSRHESLIAFSNALYYENRLITFPSPVTEDSAVRLVRVQGVYDRGGSRTNRVEAEAVVAAIERHVLTPSENPLSLGVVTFNQPQQTLIENILDARRRASPELDRALSAKVSEPLFVKNLENVQGDERDVMLFSITFGPDITGRMALNFGPLNLEGGHRRLNVAVSRARHRVEVFSSISPEQIDLSRLRAAGVRDLRLYLEYAQRGRRALAEVVSPTDGEPESPFERQVIERLRAKGWTVHSQIGAAGYRIDLGVVDPRAPGRYLLGIECDGASYHSAASARDRDRLRHLVLEGLGWKLHRIWSTDWWRNPDESLARVTHLLEQLVADGEVDTFGAAVTSGGQVNQPTPVV